MGTDRKWVFPTSSTFGSSVEPVVQSREPQGTCEDDETYSSVKQVSAAIGCPPAKQSSSPSGGRSPMKCASDSATDRSPWKLPAEHAFDCPICAKPMTGKI